MKFNQIVTEINKAMKMDMHILNEGLRFGRREINEVKKKKNDIRIGIEYEYHVRNDIKDYLDGDLTKLLTNTEIKKVEQRVQKYVLSEIESYEFSKSYDVANEYMRDRNIIEYTEILSTLKTMYKTLTHGLPNYFTAAEEINELFQKWNPDDIENGFLGFPDKTSMDFIGESFYIVADKRLSFDELREKVTALSNVKLKTFVKYLPDEFFKDSSQRKFFENGMNDLKDSILNIYEFYDSPLGDRFQRVGEVLAQREIKGFQKLVEAFSEIQEDISYVQQYLSIVYNFENMDSHWDAEIKGALQNEYKEKFTSMSYKERARQAGVDIDNIENTVFWKRAVKDVLNSVPVDDPIRNDNRETIDKIQIIKELLDKNNKWGIEPNDIEAIEHDASVPDGVEVVTNPLPLDDALDFMEKMFNHINEVGSTSSATGMHVNISIKNSFFDPKHFNPLKLTILLDPKTIRTFFPIRHYTQNVLEPFEPYLFDVARMKRNDIVPALEDLFKDTFKKQREINFGHIADQYEIEKRRVEFRYFGGHDYQNRLTTIEWNIYRAIYALMAAYTKDFGENEYRKKLFKSLDDITKREYDSEFIDLINILHKNNIDTRTQYFDYLREKDKKA